MPKLNNCFAVAGNGEWFTTRSNLLEFKSNNPDIQTFLVGSKVKVQQANLLTFGKTGTLTAVHRNAAGNLLCEINWLEGAPPLRVSVKALIRHSPHFFMVVPFSDRYRAQSTTRNSSTRREGTSPAVERFNTREEAISWANHEQRITGWNDYVILESVGMVTSGNWLTTQ